MGAWVDLGSGGLNYLEPEPQPGFRVYGSLGLRLKKAGFRESFGLQGQGFRVGFWFREGSRVWG